MTGKALIRRKTNQPTKTDKTYMNISFMYFIFWWFSSSLTTNMSFKIYQESNCTPPKKILESQDGCFVLDLKTSDTRSKKSTDQNNLILAEQHFSTNGHDFSKDIKFTEKE